MYDASHRANASQSSHVHDTQTEGGLHEHIKVAGKQFHDKYI